MRWNLAAVLLLAFLMEAGNCTAQDEVGWGGMSMSAYPGYSFYALPVANAGIGRDWVRSRDLQWQIGYNYSVVPVRIEFEHRMPSAFVGRIEIESPESFYIEETPERYPAVYSQDILVPPSVPHTFMFAPRICPQSQIMGPVEFTVRLYKSGMVKPYATQTVSAVQLEPGYLHSLWLDGITDDMGNPAVLTDSLNPNNEMELRLPSRYFELEDILSSLHFIVSVDHRQVTGLPLAARDFAFVVADLAQVRQWTEAEQSALVSYMTGGGHLCLFNAGTQPWMGFTVNQPTPAGRGFFIPVQGQMIEAREVMRKWLEGEIEEFVLWNGGTSSGWEIGEEIDSARFGIAVNFLDSLDRDQANQKVVSHRPGYMNPVWINREASRSGSSEAWESALTLDISDSRKNKRVPISTQSSSPSKQIVKLSHLATPARSFPKGLQAVLIACPLFVVLVGLFKRRRALVTGFLFMTVFVGLYVTLTAEVTPPGCASLVLIDADSRSENGSIRYITATSAGANGVISTALPNMPLVRHVALDKHAGWKISQSKDASKFEATSYGSRSVLSSDAVADVSGKLPVKVEVTMNPSGMLDCSFDTSKMPSGTNCLVQLPSGWVVLHGGKDNSKISIQIPQIAELPGKTRLQEWADYYEQISPPTEEPNFEVIQDAQASQKFITIKSDSDNVQQALDHLGWTHLLKLPTGLRGAMQNQGVVYVKSPPGEFQTGLKGHQAVFWRITFPLEESL